MGPILPSDRVVIGHLVGRAKRNNSYKSLYSNYLGAKEADLKDAQKLPKVGKNVPFFCDNQPEPNGLFPSETLIGYRQPIE